MIDDLKCFKIYHIFRDDISITGNTVEEWTVRLHEFGRCNGGRMYCRGTEAAPIWESSKTAVKESEECSLFPSISITNVFLGLLLLLLQGGISKIFHADNY